MRVSAPGLCALWKFVRLRLKWLALGACALAACGPTPPPANTADTSYVPWLALAPTRQYIAAPPVTPPAVPPGTAECQASQLEGESLGEGAAAGNVNMPLQVRNRSASACYVHGYPDVTVLDA